MKEKNENGVTLISLVVSIIVMLILTSVTVTTSFSAYENTKAEKIKAQLRAIEDSVAEFKVDYNNEYSEMQKQNKTWSMKQQLVKYGYSSSKDVIRVNQIGSYPQYFKGTNSWSMTQWWAFFEQYYPEIITISDFYQSSAKRRKSYFYT